MLDLVQDTSVLPVENKGVRGEPMRENDFFLNAKGEAKA